VEILGRAKAILDDVEDAAAAVQRIAEGDAGTVRLGITPPAAPVLAPHLAAALRAEAPDVNIVVRRMWLPDLERAVADVDEDVTLRSPAFAYPTRRGSSQRSFCAEPLVVSLRGDHPSADRPAIELCELSNQTLGMHSRALFPAWAMTLRQVLNDAGVSPPTAELADTDLSACRWPAQPEVRGTSRPRSAIDPEAMLCLLGLGRGRAETPTV
jgi:DNA-binding transcriptional LysR family regulator